jgi:hypothetical protein
VENLGVDRRHEWVLRAPNAEDRRPNGREKFIECGKVGRMSMDVGYRFDEPSACKDGNDREAIAMSSTTIVAGDTF